MAKTLTVISDRGSDGPETVLPAEYARGLYVRNAPGALALKLMHALIAKAGSGLADPHAHEVRLAELRAIAGMKNLDRAALTPLFEELRAVVLTYDDPDAALLTIGGLLDTARIDYRHEAGGEVLIRWWFGAAFREMAENSDHWALIDRQTLYALTSKYSILLFQHFASLQGLEFKTAETFTVEQLRVLLGVPEGKLERFANLNRDALQPALDEINQLARFTLTATLKKAGRSVVAVEIAWTSKDSGRSKVTKRGHAKPVASQASAEATALRPFPSEGGTSFLEPFRSIREAAGLNEGQGRAVADAFRADLKTQGVPLDAPDVAERFRIFCEAWKA